MSNWNLPPGCTPADIERQAGSYDGPGFCQYCRRPLPWDFLETGAGDRYCDHKCETRSETFGGMDEDEQE